MLDIDNSKNSIKTEKDNDEILPDLKATCFSEIRYSNHGKDKNENRIVRFIFTFADDNFNYRIAQEGDYLVVRFTKQPQP